MQSKLSILTPVLALAGFCAVSVHAQTIPVLTVQGSADVRVVSDLATVRLGIVGQASTADAAQRQVNQIANEILEAVRDVGVEERHIQTARLTLTPIYARQRTVEDVPEIIAYRASNAVSVRVEDLRRVGEVIDAGLEAGANQLESVVFDVSDDLPAREEALQGAIREARSKAAIMASALDVRLNGVLSVDEGGVFVQRPQMEAARVAAFQADQATPVSPGEVTVSASVTVRYRILEDD